MADEAPVIPPVRLRLPTGYPNGPVSVFDGATTREYVVKNQEVVVDADHVTAVLAAIPGSTRTQPETPVITVPEPPAKEK